MKRLSPKMRIVALVGGVLVLGMVAFKFLLMSPATPATVAVAPVVHHSTPVRTAAKRHPARPAPVKLDPGLPAPLRQALMHSKVVVAVLYAPDAPGDRDALSAARAGASAAHVGFAVLNVRREPIARAVATLVAGASDPSVLVFRRPGTIALRLPGYIDADIVAQAARSTRP